MNKYIYKLNFDFFCKKNVKIEIQIHLYGKLQNTIIFKIYFKNYLCQSFRYYFLIFISALKLLDSKKKLAICLKPIKSYDTSYESDIPIVRLRLHLLVSLTSLKAGIAHDAIESLLEMYLNNLELLEVVCERGHHFG